MHIHIYAYVNTLNTPNHSDSHCWFFHATFRRCQAVKGKRMAEKASQLEEENHEFFEGKIW